MVTEPHQFEKYFEAHVEVPKTELKHKYTVEITRALFSEESYLVYEKYQNTVHNKDKDKETREGYIRFLC